MERCTPGISSALVAAIALLLGPQPAGAAPAMDAPAAGQPARGRFGVTLSYFGDNGTHPGILTALEYPLPFSGRTHEVLARAQLGGWIHPRMYAGLFTGGEVAYRATAAFGLRGELAAGAGYLRTFLASDVYEVQADGSISEATDWGRSHFMPSSSIGVGWDFARREGLPLAVMLRSQAFWEFPYSTRWLLHAAAMVGVTYTW